MRSTGKVPEAGGDRNVIEPQRPMATELLLTISRSDRMILRPYSLVSPPMAMEKSDGQFVPGATDRDAAGVARSTGGVPVNKRQLCAERDSLVAEFEKALDQY